MYVYYVIIWRDLVFLIRRCFRVGFSAACGRAGVVGRSRLTLFFLSFFLSSFALLVFWLHLNKLLSDIPVDLVCQCVSAGEDQGRD